MSSDDLLASCLCRIILLKHPPLQTPNFSSYYDLVLDQLALASSTTLLVQVWCLESKLLD
jgi:hypothetical protein